MMEIIRLMIEEQKKIRHKCENKLINPINLIESILGVEFKTKQFVKLLLNCWINPNQ